MTDKANNPHEPRKLYFAYGSNLYKPQMRFNGGSADPVSGEYSNRCPDSIEIAPFILQDYRLAFVGKTTQRWGPGGVATVIPAPGAQVQGALYRISAADETLLDQLEFYVAADPQVGNYDKDETSAQYNGEVVMFYVATARLVGEVPPSKKYLETIRLGFEMWGLRLSAISGIATSSG